MKRLTLLPWFPLTAALILSCGGIWVTSCATANRSAYVAEAGTHTSVKVAMGLWDQWVKAGKATPVQEQKVKSLFEKVRLTMISVCDAGAIVSASSQTNNAAAALSQGLSQAVSEAGQAQSDLLAALKGFGLSVN